MVFKKNYTQDLDLDEDYITFKEFKKLKRRINAQENYLNIINLFFEIEPKEILLELRKLSLEFLRFFDNICRKYDFTYILDDLTLNEAIMFGDFINWDINLFVGVLKKDYNKLIKTLKRENDNYNLNIDFSKNTIKFNIISLNFKLYRELSELDEIKFGNYYFKIPYNPEKNLKIPTQIFDLNKIDEVDIDLIKKYNLELKK